MGSPRFTAEYKEKFIKSGKKLHLKSLSEASDTLVLSCYKDRDVNASITIGDIPTPDVPKDDITPGAITMFFDWSDQRYKFYGCADSECSHHCCPFYSLKSITYDAFLCFMKIFVRTGNPIAAGVSAGGECALRPVR